MKKGNQFTCKAVLFDLDGTLIDSFAVIERIWRKWAIERGLPAEEVLQASYGLRTLDAVYLLAPDTHVEEEAARIEADEIQDLDGLKATPGAHSLLASLDGVPWGIVTSGSYLLATSRLKKVGLPIPSVLVSADEVQRGKPDPQGYLLAAKKLAVPHEHCIAFEDSSIGVKAALAAEMRVILVGREDQPDLSDRILGSIRDFYGVKIRRTSKGFVVQLPDAGGLNMD